ncbi:MAG TPA: FtsX-like permease family protein [Polyangiaceae bacterium LLY-WYZ-15_(1-7)]|nr:ABC transporter permease [Sandaracinus sp.]MBJ73927.1 ABC transporter permease [Sandaracinus sp.]HJL00686.1 FtsX-like permease family protein [Polyangiaceae bacterium LLY-WYZ-15_(1-7)]HJL08962.1 FtsX-like permease family protein [Polyangiaceae bacterium LLY-WYZ-15_(1-7)]
MSEPVGGWRRQRALLDYALGSLRRRGRRNGAMVVALMVVVGVYASVLFLSESLRHEWEQTLEATPDLVVQRMVAGRPTTIEAGALEAVVPTDAPGVRRAWARTWGYLFVEAIGANLTVIGAGPGERAFARSLVGEPLPAEEGEVPFCLVGDALAERLAVRPGDRLAIPDARQETRVLEVAGVFDAASALHVADVMVVREATARELLALPAGQATDLAVELARPEEAPVVAAGIRERMPDARVIDRRALVRTYELTFDGRSGLLGALLVPCLAALFLLAWDRLTGLGDAERREIGVLKAIGWETRDVIAARLWESALVAIAGAWLGVLLAYGYVFGLGAPGLAGALFGWSALHPELALTPVIDATQAWTLVGLVVLPFVGVAVVPAWRAATLDPDEAMR